MTMPRPSGVVADYGSKTVISGISVTLEPGQILAFLGHNAASRTTTLRPIIGLLTPRAGNVIVDGQTIDRLSVADRVALRMLPEGRGIFPDLSVAENIDVVAAMKIAGRVIIANNGPIIVNGDPDEAQTSNFWHSF